MGKNILLKVIIADESPVFRFGLTTLLKNVSFVDDVKEVASAVEVLEILNKNFYETQAGRSLKREPN